MAKNCELVVCTTCRLADTDPADERDGARLSAALHAEGIPHREQECLSACTRSCAVVFRGRGFWNYVQGSLDPDVHLSDLITMWRAYCASENGIVPWRERPEIIRKNTIARIPPQEI